MEHIQHVAIESATSRNKPTMHQITTILLPIGYMENIEPLVTGPELRDYLVISVEF